MVSPIGPQDEAPISTVKLSDYVIQTVAEHGVKQAFMLPGGGAMHLNESLGRRDDLALVCNLHEQAVAIAAEAHAKVTNELSVAMVTTGPGGTNAITGVASAWLDSMPVLVLSGQVKRDDLKRDSGVRILGVQEIDIVSIVESITKYAVTIDDPSTIRYHLEKAIHLALSGRRGPVWIDIPLDVQAAQIDPAAQRGFSPPAGGEPEGLEEQVTELLALLRSSERPVVVAGYGIRSAGAVPEFREAIEKMQAPVLTTWLGMDLIADDHVLNAGRPGSIAPRGANYAMQNSDLMLVIGSRLDMALTGYAHDKLARGAVKVMVDIDEAEIRKMKTPIGLEVVADARDFLRELNRRLDDAGSTGAALPSYQAWTARCHQWKQRYPIIQPEYRELPDRVSTYCFSEALSAELTHDDVVASGSSGTGVELFLLAFQVKEGQRVLHSRGLGAMGFGLPASIGACLASGGKRTICVDGDGSFQMNIQELETVRRLQLPIKFFVINNAGYASIRTSQTNYFHHLVAADATSGLSLPDVKEVARAYGIPAVSISNQSDLRGKIREVIQTPGPIVCEVLAPDDEERAPRLSSMQRADGSMVSKPLEDLWPFLDRDEFRSNMLIEPLDE
jgi:acetolactate synthase-1/2/3 large subunit